MKSFFFMNTKITADISDDRNPKTLEVGLFTSSNFAELGMFPSINFNVIAKEMKQSRSVTPLIPAVIDWAIIQGSKILLTTKQMYSILKTQVRSDEFRVRNKNLKEKALNRKGERWN